MYHFYKPVLIALLFCGIDSFPESQNRLKCVRNIVVKFNQVLTVVNVVCGIQMTVSLNDMSPTSLSVIFVWLCGSFLKYSLYRKKKQLFNFIFQIKEYKISKRYVPSLQSYKKKFDFALAFILLSQAIQLMTTTIYINREKYYIPPAFYILQKFNITITDNFLFFETKFCFIVSYVHNIYPLTIFILLYSVLAWHLKVIVDNILYVGNSVSFHKLFEMYNKIFRLIKAADLLLRGLVLIAVFFISTYLYFTLFSLLQSGMSASIKNLSAMYFIVFTLVQLYVMVYNAAGILDVNEDIHSLVLDRYHDSSNYSEKMFLLMKTQKAMGLTIGGLVIIKRGVFINLLGTILTYCLLVKSFPL